MFVAERAGRETLIFEVVGSKPIRSKVLLVRDLFLFLFCFIKLVFVVFSLVFLKSHVSCRITIANSVSIKHIPSAFGDPYLFCI